MVWFKPFADCQSFLSFITSQEVLGLTHWSKRLGFRLLTLTMEAIGGRNNAEYAVSCDGLKCVATVIPLYFWWHFSMMSSLKEKLF